MKDKVITKHRASSSKRWFNCPGSYSLSLEIPQEPASVFAAEGTVAHNLSELFLKHWTRDLIDITNEDAFMDMVSLFRLEHEGKSIEQEGFDINITPEMINTVLRYVMYTRKLLIGEGCEWVDLNIETELNISSEFGFTGTADAWFISKNPFTKVVHLIDLKYGKGVFVEVKDNYQLRNYAVGLYNKEPFEEIYTHIVQPRIKFKEPTRMYSYKNKEIIDFSRLLNTKIDETFSKDKEFSEGDWCRWCPAAENKCPLKERKILQIETKLSLDPKTPEEYGLLQQHIISAEKTIKAVKTKILKYAEKGGKVAGFVLSPSRGTREWANAKEVIGKLEGDFGTDIYMLRSPAQMEKIKGVPKELIGELTVTISKSKTLKPSKTEEDILDAAFTKIK